MMSLIQTKMSKSDNNSGTNMKHVVRYYESERGWGSETYFLGYDTKEAAEKAIADTNARNTASSAPAIYTIAYYHGLMSEIPKDYKN